MIADSHRKKQILRCAQDDRRWWWLGFCDMGYSLRTALETGPSLRFGMTFFISCSGEKLCLPIDVLLRIGGFGFVARAGD